MPSAAQEQLRRQAVRDGMTQLEAARIFGVTRQTIGVWVNKSGNKSLDVLAAKPQGRPKGKVLPPRQAKVISLAISNKPPDQLRLASYLWTREAVGRLIEKREGVRLSVWTAGRYLREWGFTPQKPIRPVFEADLEAVRRWLEEEYPVIRALARRNKAEIYWRDVMGTPVGSCDAEDLRPPDVEKTRKDISGYLRGRQRRPQIVMNDFKHESVRYAS